MDAVGVEEIPSMGYPHVIVYILGSLQQIKMLDGDRQSDWHSLRALCLFVSSFPSLLSSTDSVFSLEGSLLGLRDK